MQLVTTLQHRPYVFLFLVTFLTIGILNRGVARTLLFLTVGFTVAFLSEVSSIRNGFPYGLYHYLYENLRGEIVVGGVPLWDSLSYSFIAYASYETASFLGGPLGRGQPLFAATLMTLLDVIIDPLAVRGDRWFLGRIFYYPTGGVYFGVPLSNFAGWFLVGLVILTLIHLLESRLPLPAPPLRVPSLGPLFYASIAAFNLALTFAIGERSLGFLGGALLITSIAVLVVLRRRRRGVSGSLR